MSATDPTDPDAITTVVFDMGGVLLDWDPRHLYRKVFDDPAAMEHFLSEVCPLSWHLQHDRGAPFAETLPARAALHPDHADHIVLWGSRYDEMIAGEVPGTADVVAELAALGLRLLGLTNLPAEVWPSVRASWPVMTAFEGVLVSGEEGLVKPDPAIFELLLDRFAIEPARAVFVDDVAANVAAAQAVGLHALRFTDAPTLRVELAGLGVDLPA